MSYLFLSHGESFMSGVFHRLFAPEAYECGVCLFGGLNGP